MTEPSTRANSRRPKSAGARNRGVQDTAGQQPIRGLWGFEEHAGGGECPAHRCEWMLRLFGAARPGYSQESRLPVCTEAIFELLGGLYGERWRGRAKPSSDRGQYSGLETAITAS